MSDNQLPRSRKARLRAARAHAEGRDLHVPVRRVITRSTARILRELASIKMRCAVPCESGIEYDHYVVLDVRRDVSAFYAQPEHLRYLDPDGRLRSHYPDVKVEFASGAVEFHEVKPDAVADDPAFKALQECVAAVYAERGFKHLVMRESVVRAEPRLGNAKLLRHHRGRRVDAAALAAVRAALSGGDAAFGDLGTELGRGAAGDADLLAMALQGHLDLDWETVEIGPGTRVRLAPGRPR